MMLVHKTNKNVLLHPALKSTLAKRKLQVIYGHWGMREMYYEGCLDGNRNATTVLFFPCSLPAHRLVGLVVRRPPRERKIPGSNPACARIFRGRVIPVTQKLALQWLPCQAPGVIGSALGLVGLVSVYCDWVR